MVGNKDDLHKMETFICVPQIENSRFPVMVIPLISVGSVRCGNISIPELFYQFGRPPTPLSSGMSFRGWYAAINICWK